MTDAATSAQAPTRGVTNRTLVSRDFSVSFREITDVNPADHAAEEGPEHHTRHRFLAGPILDDPTVDREKWLYVFLADLTDDLSTVLDTSLHYEGQYDEEGALRLVDWRGGAGSYPGVDRRPLQSEAEPDGVLHLTLTGRRAHHGPAVEGVRTVYLAFLSHVPLPAHRLDRYFSSDPEVRLPARALLLDPDATADDGGYGPTVATAGASTSPWVQWLGDRTHARAYLTDPVDFALTLHERYTAAANVFDAYTLENAERLLHASLTRAVATGYKAQHDFASKGKTDADVPGRVFEALGRYEAEVEAEQNKVEFWADHLYGWWMESAAFELAREDASDYGPLAGLTEPQLDEIEAEIARQAELLQGADRSLRGKAYLVAHLAQADAGAWYDRVALASRIAARIADVPKVLFEGLAESAAETARVAVKDIADLDARRAAIQRRRLGSAADLLTAHEFAKIGAPAAAGRIDERQLRLLDPMVRAVGGSPSPSADAARDVLRRNAALRSGAGVDALADLDRALRTGGGLGALPTWQTLAPGGAGALSAPTVPQAGLVLTDPAALASGDAVVHGPERVVVYQRPLVDSGLLVLTGSDGGEALADLRAVLGGAARPAAPGPTAPPSAKRSALSRLLDVTGRPLDQSSGARLREIREAVAARRTELNEAQLREQARTRHVNWAGRLFIALNLLDVVAGVAETQAKWEDGDRALRRGASRWDAYIGVVGAGAGTLSAGAGLLESLESVIPARLTAGGLGTALNVAAGVGSFLAVVAGLASFYQEGRTHDRMGMASAGFAVAAGAVGLAAATPLIGVLAASLSIPIAGWFVAAVILVFAGLSLLFHFLSDTPTEEWLKTSIWSVHENGEVEGIAPNAPRVTHEVEDLLALLAAPHVSVELRESVEGEPTRLKRYGVERVAHPHRVRVVVRPGLHPPGSEIEITGFEVLLPFTWGEWAEDVLPFSEGERDQLPARIGGTFPDPENDVVLVHDERGPAFVREWAGSALPEAFLPPTARTPRGTDFSCRATVRLPPGVGDVRDPVFDVEGAIGFAHGDDRRVVAVTTSVSSAEPVR